MCADQGQKDHENSLAPSVQQVYIEMLRNRVFSLGDVTDITGNYQTSRTTIKRLVKKGYVLRARGGLYAAVPPEFLNSNYEVDRYILAYKNGREGGALAYHSALELHGVAQSYFNTVYYLTKRSLRGFTFQSVQYRFFETQDVFGATKIIRDAVPVMVTDRERTFLDCVRRPKYCGGLEEILKSLGTFHTVDTKKMGKYLKKFDEKGLTQKTGAVLSLLKDEFRVPDDFLEHLKEEVGNKVYYLTTPPRKGQGKLMSEWNVVIPKNIDEVMRFV